MSKVNQSQTAGYEYLRNQRKFTSDLEQYPWLSIRIPRKVKVSVFVVLFLAGWNTLSIISGGLLLTEIATASAIILLILVVSLATPWEDDKTSNKLKL